jgi:hypothetical protein
MNLLIGIGALLTWLIADILLGIKNFRQNNLIYKFLLISINLVFVILSVLLSIS